MAANAFGPYGNAYLLNVEKRREAYAALTNEQRRELAIRNNEQRRERDSRYAQDKYGNNKYKELLSSRLPPPKRKGWFSRRRRSKNRSTRKRK
jgi:hypothetical protein